MTKVIFRDGKRIQGTICPFCVNKLTIAPKENWELHQRIWHTDPEVAEAERRFAEHGVAKRPRGLVLRDYEHGLWQS